MQRTNGRLNGRTVLVVEDEFFLADDLVRALTADGATVLGPVSAVSRARELLRSHTPDVAVLDVNLKGEMVFPLADDLEARGVPFLFTSGYGSGEIPLRFSGVSRWEKPYDVQALIASLVVTPEKN